jgi:hypothetical protein
VGFPKTIAKVLTFQSEIRLVFWEQLPNSLKYKISISGYEPEGREFDREAGLPAEQASIAQRCHPISPGAPVK